MFAHTKLAFKFNARNVKMQICLLERLIHSHMLNLSFTIWRLQSNGQKLYPNFQSCMAEEFCDYIALFAFQHLKTPPLLMAQCVLGGFLILIAKQKSIIHFLSDTRMICHHSAQRTHICDTQNRHSIPHQMQCLVHSKA